MAIICLRKMIMFLPLSLLLICLATSVCEAERCEVLCSIESLRDQCERCRLRIPMRFGKRSSPPEALFDFAGLASSTHLDTDAKSLENAGDLKSEFLQFLTNSLRNYPPSNLLNGRESEESDSGKENAQLDWMKSRLPLTIVRRKRALPTLTSSAVKRASPPGGSRMALPKSPYYFLKKSLSSGSAKAFAHSDVPHSASI